MRRAGAVAVPVAADLGAVEAGRILRATRVTAAVTATPGEPVAAAATGRTLTTSDLEVGGDGAVEAAGDDAAAATASGPGPAEILAVSRHLSPPLLVVRGAGEAAGGRWPAAGRSALVHAFPVGTVAGQDALLSALGANPLTVVALPALDTARIAELVRSGHVDACALHPAAARALLDSGAMPPAAAGSLALLVVAGDDMPDGLLGRLRDAFPAAAIEVVSPPAFAPPHRPGDAVATAPVAVSQEGMLWHECFAPGCQNLPGLARRYRGPLDVAALRRALDEILRRHDALRSGFEVRAGTPLQTIRAHEPLVLETHDLSGLVPVDREAEVARRVARAGSRPFDLVSDALFAPELLRLDAEDHVLVIRTHHTVFDDWSVGVFRRELAALYAAFAAGAGTPLPDLEVTFAGFSTRQRERLAGPDAAGAMEFWRGELADAPLVTQLPVGDPDLPPGAPQASPEPVTLDLPANLRDGVRSLARSEHVTVYMATLAAFGVLTARVTGQDDLLLTTVVANRNRAELEGLIGCFTKKVPLRLRLGGDPTFREVLARTRQAVLGAVAHQEPAFDGVLQDVLGAPAARHGLVPHAAVVFQGVTPERDLVLPEVDSVGLDTSARTARAHFASASDRGAAPAPGLPWGSGLQLGTFVILTLVDDRERLSFAARGAFHGPAVGELLDLYGALLAVLVSHPAGRVSEVATPAAPGRWSSPTSAGPVDLRGYRVDPARVEAALAGCPGAAGARIEVRRDGGGAEELVAHVVAGGTPPSLAELRAWEWSRLPGYAWPAALSVTPSEAGVAPACDPRSVVLRAAYAAARGVDDVGPDTRYWQDFAFLDAIGRARDAGVAVPGSLAGRTRTVGALAIALAARTLRDAL